MVSKVNAPSIIEAEGNIPKIIEEYFGNVNSGNAQISVAKMSSPGGWEEPGQTPEFDEYTVVIAGTLCVESKDGTTEVTAGQAIFAPKGEWVRYSSPHQDGAEYLAVCMPAFHPDTVNRDR